MKKPNKLMTRLRQTQDFVQEVQMGNKRLAEFCAELGYSQFVNSASVTAIATVLDKEFPELKLKDKITVEYEKEIKLQQKKHESQKVARESKESEKTTGRDNGAANLSN